DLAVVQQRLTETPAPHEPQVRATQGPAPRLLVGAARSQQRRVDDRLERLGVELDLTGFGVVDQGRELWLDRLGRPRQGPARSLEAGAGIANQLLEIDEVPPGVRQLIEGNAPH